jgi:hypothetical protein
MFLDLTQEEIEKKYFVASCYFDDLPKGTKFCVNHNSNQYFEYEKITKRDIVIDGIRFRFIKPKSRHVYLLIPREKFIDFCKKRNYKYKTPSTQLLIKLHNDIT